jgi:hypothetical protein
LDLVHTHECGIGTEFAKFISWEYIDDIFIALYTEDVGRDCGFGVLLYILNFSMAIKFECYVLQELGDILCSVPHCL